MHIVITGGTGFIGQALCQAFPPGYQLTVLSRQPEEKVRQLCGPHVQAIHDLDALPDSAEIDAIVNLAGEPIADRRWSKKQKARLLDSRLSITRDICTLVSRLERKPQVLVSGSAVGFYGDQQDQEVTESTVPHKEFTHELCHQWESAALECAEQTRVCLLRTGLVIGPHGGFLQRMLPPFKMGLGTSLGSGNQYMPWIHRHDMVEIIRFLIDSPEISGPVNAVAPNPVQNREFTRQLAAALHRPAVFRAPSPILKMALGEMSRLLLTGQKAKPKVLMDADFDFEFKNLEKALLDVVGGKTPQNI